MTDKPMIYYAVVKNIPRETGIPSEGFVIARFEGNPYNHLNNKPVELMVTKMAATIEEAWDICNRAFPTNVFRPGSNAWEAYERAVQHRMDELGH